MSQVGKGDDRFVGANADADICRTEDGERPANEGISCSPGAPLLVGPLAYLQHDNWLQVHFTTSPILHGNAIHGKCDINTTGLLV